MNPEVLPTRKLIWLDYEKTTVTSKAENQFRNVMSTVTRCLNLRRPLLSKPPDRVCISLNRFENGAGPIWTLYGRYKKHENINIEVVTYLKNTKTKRLLD